VVSCESSWPLLIGQRSFHMGTGVKKAIHITVCESFQPNRWMRFNTSKQYFIDKLWRKSLLIIDNTLNCQCTRIADLDKSSVCSSKCLVYKSTFKRRLLYSTTSNRWLILLTSHQSTFTTTTTRLHTLNGPFSEITQVSRYQKGKTNLDFTEARDSEWQWHQLGHM